MWHYTLTVGKEAQINICSDSYVEPLPKMHDAAATTTTATD
jgi:hypothetical protein